MKKFLTIVLSAGCFAGMILAAAENKDGSCDFVWSACCLAGSVLCGWLLTKVNPHFKDGGLNRPTV